LSHAQGRLEATLKRTKVMGMLLGLLLLPLYLLLLWAAVDLAWWAIQREVARLADQGFFYGFAFAMLVAAAMVTWTIWSDSVRRRKQREARDQNAG
jgi:hypothetical protein